MLNERKLTKAELAKREDIIMKMKKNKRELVKRYGKDAEKVMYGRATQLAKKQAEAMDQDRIKEMVKAALMGPVKEDQVEEGNAFIVAADAARDAGKKEFEFPEGSGKMHPVKIKADIDELDATEKAASDKIGRGEEFTDDDAAAVADKMPKIKKDTEFELMGEAFLLDTEIEDIADALGYDSITHFFEDNPGAVDAVMDWVQGIPEFSKVLRDADLMEDLDEGLKDKLKGALYGIAGTLGVQKYGMDVFNKVTGAIANALPAEKAYEFSAYIQDIVDLVANTADKIPMEEDLDLGHQDNEPHMLKADLYRIGKYAMELYQMVDQFEEGSEEVDFPHWWQAKVIKAKDMLVSAKHYLDFEIKEPQIDAMVDVAQEEEVIDEAKSLKDLVNSVSKKGNLNDVIARAKDMAKEEGLDFSDEEIERAVEKSFDRMMGLGENARDKAAMAFDKMKVGATIKTSKGEFKKVDDKHFEMVGKPGRKFTAKQMTFIKEEAMDEAQRADLKSPFSTKPDSLKSLLDKYDLGMGWYEKYIIGVDELTPKEEADLEYVEDRIKAHLQVQGRLNEGTWSLGTAKQIVSAINSLEMLQGMDAASIADSLEDDHKFYYNVIGDDLFHDALDRAEREAGMGNLDRAQNGLFDAVARAEELLAIVRERESSRPYKTDIFEKVAGKLAKQLKSK